MEAAKLCDGNGSNSNHLFYDYCTGYYNAIWYVNLVIYKWEH